MKDLDEQALAAQIIAATSSTDPTPDPTPTPTGGTSDAWKRTLAQELATIEPEKVSYCPNSLLDTATGLTGKHLNELRAIVATAGANQLKAFAKQGKEWTLREWESLPTRPSRGEYSGFIEIAPQPYENPRYSALGGLFAPTEYTKYLHELKRHHAATYGRLKPFRGPVAVELNFYLAKPVKKCRKAHYADTKPDLDNLCKAFIDSLDYLAAAENRQRAKARKRIGELAKFTGDDPRKDLFPKLQYGSVLVNDSRVVKLTASKEYAEQSPTLKPGIAFRVVPLYDQTDPTAGGGEDA